MTGAAIAAPALNAAPKTTSTKLRAPPPQKTKNNSKYILLKYY